LEDLQKLIDTDLTLSGFPGFKLDFEGEIETLGHNQTSLFAEELFQEKLKNSRDIDAIKGGCSIGPHRSDLSFYFYPKNTRGYLCSTGEQKVLILGLILASIKLLKLKGEGIPILLLDEVIAHLDEKYRSILFEQIKQLKIQTWMTGIHKEDFKNLSQISVFFSPKA
jgi:DNA replication and repair protein RecF